MLYIFKENFCMYVLSKFFPMFLTNYGNTREDFGELDAETLVCDSCSHSISRFPKFCVSITRQKHGKCGLIFKYNYCLCVCVRRHTDAAKCLFRLTLLFHNIRRFILFSFTTALYQLSFFMPIF